MKQFALPEDYRGEQILPLREDRFHHLIHVLRVKSGETMVGIDRQNQRYSFKLVDIKKDVCMLHRYGSSRIVTKDHHITLFQCLLKGKKMGQVVRQATETGVDRIVPVISEFSIPRPGNNPEKIERLRRIALEAVEQSGAEAIPEITPPILIERVGELLQEETVSFYCHNDGASYVQLHDKLSKPVKNLALIIGPEGGLSDNDRFVLETSGVFPLYLGDTTLRSETAAVFALGAVHILFLEKDTWKQINRL